MPHTITTNCSRSAAYPEPGDRGQRAEHTRLRVFHWRPAIAAAVLTAAACTWAAARAEDPPGALSTPLQQPQASPLGISRAPHPLEEEIPPFGKGHMLSESQIRYCLAEFIRIEAVRPVMNRYRRDQVEFFNAVIAAYNSRCAKYRYELPAMDRAKYDVETNRSRLEAEARQAFLERFQGPEKGPDQQAAQVAAAPEARQAQAAAAPETAPAESQLRAAAQAPSQPVTPPEAASREEPRQATVTTPEPSTPAPARPQVTQSAEAPVPQAPQAPNEPSVEPVQAVAATLPPPSTRAPEPPLAVATPSPSAVTQPAHTPESAAPVRKPEPAPATATPTPPAAPEPAPNLAQPPQPQTAQPAVAIEPSTAGPAQAQTRPAPPAPAPESAAAAPAPQPAAPAAAALPSPAQPPAAETAEQAQPEPSLGVSPPQPPATPAQPAAAAPAAPTTPAETTVARAAPAGDVTRPSSTRDVALARFERDVQRAGRRVLDRSRYPELAKMGKKWTGKAQIEVQFAAGGYISRIVLAESCGHPPLDEKALELARTIMFPHVPKELTSRNFSVRFPIEFRSGKG